MGDLVKNKADLMSLSMKEVEDKIVSIRGHDVIADADVAAMYRVETKRVNEAVKNNPDKFCREDYMFELTKDEVANLRSKISTTKVSTKSRNPTKVFTEKGLYMLATILHSERATSKNITLHHTSYIQHQPSSLSVISV